MAPGIQSIVYVIGLLVASATGAALSPSSSVIIVVK